MMRLAKWMTAVGFLVFTVGMFGQGVVYSNTALAPTTNTNNSPARFESFATIRVCTEPASGSTCSPLANIYSNVALTVPLINPFSADQYGNFLFYAAPGTYHIQVSGPGLTQYDIPYQILGNGQGTITLLNTTSPLTGGPITTNGTIACPTCVATGTEVGPINGVQNACAQSGSDFGAKLYAAELACVGSSNCQVQVCAGSFTPTSQVPLLSGVHFVGAGEGATNLTWNQSGSKLFVATDVNYASIESMTLTLGASGAGMLDAGVATYGGTNLRLSHLELSGGNTGATWFNFTGTTALGINRDYIDHIDGYNVAGKKFHFDHTIDVFMSDAATYSTGATNLTDIGIEWDTDSGGLNLSNVEFANGGKHGMVVQNKANTVTLTGSVSAGSSVVTPVGNSALCHDALVGGYVTPITDGTNIDYPTVTAIPDGSHITLSSITHGYAAGATVTCGLPPSHVFAKSLIIDCQAGGDALYYDPSIFQDVVDDNYTTSWFAGAGLNCQTNTVVTPGAIGVHISGGAAIQIAQSDIRANASSGVKLDGTGASAVEVVSVVNNLIHSNNWGNTAGVSGIDVPVATNEVRITDNSITNNVELTGHQAYGINLTGGGQNFVIVGNRLQGNATGPMYNFPVVVGEVCLNTNGLGASPSCYINGPVNIAGFLAVTANGSIQNLTTTTTYAYPPDGTVGMSVQPATGSDGATPAFICQNYNATQHLCSIFKSGAAQFLNLSAYNGSGWNLLTTSAGKLDAAQLANGTGVAPCSALASGCVGSGNKVILDNQTAAQVPNSALVNPSTTVNGQPCTLGSTCTPFLTGTTGTITGTALTATCDSGTATVTGATVGHPVSVSTTDGTDVGGAFYLRASVTSTNTVTVYVCGTGTPPSKAYNVTTQ